MLTAAREVVLPQGEVKAPLRWAEFESSRLKVVLR